MSCSRKRHCFCSKFIITPRIKQSKFYKIACSVHILTVSITQWACVIIVTMLLVEATELLLVHTKTSQTTLCNDACNVTNVSNYLDGKTGKNKRLKLVFYKALFQINISLILRFSNYSEKGI
jgi:hypothetical protein